MPNLKLPPVIFPIKGAAPPTRSPKGAKGDGHDRERSNTPWSEVPPEAYACTPLPRTKCPVCEQPEFDGRSVEAARQIKHEVGWAVAIIASLIIVLGVAGLIHF